MANVKNKIRREFCITTGNRGFAEDFQLRTDYLQETEEFEGVIWN